MTKIKTCSLTNERKELAVTNHIRTAKKHIERIADVLPQHEDSLENFTYEEGKMGLSLFYCYFAQYTGEDRYFQLAEEYFDKAVSLTKMSSKYKTIYKTDSIDCHFSNLGRFLEFAKKNEFLDMDTNIYLKEVDDVMYDLMKNKIKAGDIDLSSGAMAAGHYFLNRFNSNSLLRSPLEDLILGLEKNANKDEDGDYYWTAPILADNIYLGLSHGSAMIVSFLVAMHENEILPDKCKELIIPAVNFIFKHQRQQERGLFPLILGDEIEPKQFSQCYGDLGTAYSLFRAISVIRDEKLECRVSCVLDKCIERKREDGLTWDASIYYGASGLAALFDKIYRLSAEQKYETAADYWYKQILTYSKCESGVVGYCSMLRSTEEFWNVSFGWGVIGVGISLMKYVRKDLPSLDGLIMTM